MNEYRRTNKTVSLINYHFHAGVEKRFKQFAQEIWE